MKPSELIIHIAVGVLFPPLLPGMINKTKAVFAGRIGPPLLQPYFDILKLLHKDSVFSSTTTWVFRLGPMVSLVAALFALLLIPLGGDAAPLSFEGDLVLFAYLFGLSRFFTVAAALDTGSAFEGMGGAREVTFACLAEPALFLALMVLVRQTGSLTLAGMLGPSLLHHWHQIGGSLVMVVVSLFIVLLAENSRIPFDDPNTHLELTMIHEVMVLDHSGPLFGVILYGASLKLFVMGAVIVRICAPPDPSGGWGNWGLFIGGSILLSVTIGVVEAVMARLRLQRIPSLLVGACLLSAFAIAFLPG